MQPSLFLALLLLALAALPGCDRPASTSTNQAPANPTPEASSKADQMRAKNGEAAQATGDYLKEKGLELKASLEQAGDQLGIDKDAWRQQLEQTKKDLQPQIDELKRKAAAAGEQAKPEYNRQIVNLEEQRKKADAKLAQLRSASGAAWETFKARWKQEQAEPSPTPTP